MKVAEGTMFKVIFFKQENKALKKILQSQKGRADLREVIKRERIISSHQMS